MAAAPKAAALAALEARIAALEAALAELRAKPEAPSHRAKYQPAPKQLWAIAAKGTGELGARRFGCEALAHAYIRDILKDAEHTTYAPVKV